jgi:antitoxin (DNA-binding transcriptional repressor) of toxin-antitoxin stability system
MKAIDVREFKAHLSKYLRMVSRGSRFVVMDRDEPIAQIGPVARKALSWQERLAQEGRLRLGSQAWDEVKISKLDRQVDIQVSLRAVREDPNERHRH